MAEPVGTPDGFVSAKDSELWAAKRTAIARMRRHPQWRWLRDREIAAETRRWRDAEYAAHDECGRCGRDIYSCAEDGGCADLDTPQRERPYVRTEDDSAWGTVAGWFVANQSEHDPSWWHDRIARLPAGLDRRDVYAQYLASALWKFKRVWYLRHECESCGSNRLLQLHHLSYDRVGIEHPADLVTLCRVCHEREHKAAA